MPRKKTLKEFIEKAKEIHGNKYDYSLVNYKDNKTSITVICPTHGEFSIRPDIHLWQQQGCRSCGYERNSQNFKHSLKQFVEKANKIHNLKYSYEKAIYIKRTEKICVTCPEHGDFFVLASEHLSGVSCKKCSDNLRKDTFESFLKKAQKVHGERYIYFKEKFNNSKTKIDVKCSVCHNIFQMRPNTILQGSGCPVCNRIGGFTRTSFIDLCKKKKRTPTVYILFCKNEFEKFFKIGITSRDLSLRYHSSSCLPYPFKVLYQIKGEPEKIYDVEKTLIRDLNKYNYQPSKAFGGSFRECFEGSQEVLTIIKKVLHGI